MEYYTIIQFYATNLQFYINRKSQIIETDSVPLLSDYTPVCAEEGCSQLLMCSCLKMKRRHGKFSFMYQWHYLL